MQVQEAESLKHRSDNSASAHHRIQIRYHFISPTLRHPDVSSHTLWRKDPIYLLQHTIFSEKNAFGFSPESGIPENIPWIGILHPLQTEHTSFDYSRAES